MKFVLDTSAIQCGGSNEIALLSLIFLNFVLVHVSSIFLSGVLQYCDSVLFVVCRRVLAVVTVPYFTDYESHPFYT